MAKLKDPTQAMLDFARSLEGVNEGLSCNQTAFKFGKKAFFYVGEQGGRFKTMFKLDQSLDQARELEAKRPKDYQVGHMDWVTARFSSDKPLGVRTWKKWLTESYLRAGGTL